MHFAGGYPAAQLPAMGPNTSFDDIKGILTLVDGTLLPALPQLVQAMWQDEQHRERRKRGSGKAPG